MSYQPRRILPPGASRKRKEREALYTSQPLPSEQQPASKAGEQISSNQLLAGYMAYEFLTKGSLFGRKFEPARADAVPLSGGSVESKGGKVEAEPTEHKSYAEVASILKTDGAHIPQIVNPTQLERWIQM